MVPPTPLYALAEIRTCAAAGRVSMGKKVQLDIQNLGYTTADVCACLCALAESDYRKTVKYGDIEYDVYRPKFPGPSGQIDDLYVKVGQKGTTVAQVHIASFHLPRFA